MRIFLAIDNSLLAHLLDGDGTLALSDPLRLVDARIGVRRSSDAPPVDSIAAGGGASCRFHLTPPEPPELISGSEDGVIAGESSECLQGIALFM